MGRRMGRRGALLPLVALIGARRVVAEPITRGDAQWAFDMGGAGVHSPVVFSSRPAVGTLDEHGRPWQAHLVLAGANDHSVYALHQSNGTLAWQRSFGSRIQAGLALAAAPPPSADEPTLLVLSERGDLFGLSPTDGAKRWQGDMLGRAWATPAVVDPARVGFVGAEQYLVAFSTVDGSVLGRWPMGADVRAMPAVALNGTAGPAPGGQQAVHRGTLVVGAQSGKLVAFDLTVTEGAAVELKERWTVHLDGALDSQASPALAHGKVLIGGYAKQLACFDADTGAALWTFDEPTDVVATPWVTPDGLSAVVGSSDRHVYRVALDTGKLEWKRSVQYTVQSRPVPLDDAGSFVVAGSFPKRRSKDDNWRGPRVRALGPGGEELWAAETGGLVYGAPAVANCSVFFTDTDG